jgi:alkaline phosphatase
MDMLPLTGEYTTYAVQKGTADTPDYVTDSAASGTGWSTGVKTYNNAVSVDPVTLKPLPTILELAQKAGFKTGNITTAELTDATPAVLDSHVSLRGCQGPADMATCPNEKKDVGGLGSIAEQTVDHNVDVLMGGGKQRFDQTVTGGPFAGQTVVAQAQSQGYTVATDQAGLAAAKPGTKFLGLSPPATWTCSGRARWRSRTPARRAPPAPSRMPPARPPSRTCRT